MTSLAQSPTSRNDSSKDRAKALRQTIDDRLEQLAKAVDDVRASELFRQYLDVQARFHQYSWHNTMMIVSQKPDAERVAGFKTWHTMGRHVRKGERGAGSNNDGLADSLVLEITADECEDSDGDGRVTICHVPPGNPDNAHTITVSVKALPAHLAHGDFCGPCEGEFATGFPEPVERRHQQDGKLSSPLLPRRFH